MPLLTLLLGCLSSERSDVKAYEVAMAPVFQRNGILAQELLEAASRIKKGELDGTASAERFRRNAVPLATEIATKAAAVDPETEGLASCHDALVEAWEERAIAYRDLATAWTKSDTAAYDAARQRELQVRYAEQSYMAKVNAIANRYGVVIDLYP